MAPQVFKSFLAQVKHEILWKVNKKAPPLYGYKWSLWQNLVEKLWNMTPS